MSDDSQEKVEDDLPAKNKHLEKLKSGIESAGKYIADSSSKAAQATSKLASSVAENVAAKKEEFLENRKVKNEQFIDSLKTDDKYRSIIVDDEKLPPMVSLTVEEHETILESISDLENEIQNLKNEIKEKEDTINSLEANRDKKSKKKKKRSEKESEDKQGLGQEVGKSFNQILVTLGFSVIWAIILIAIDFQLKDRGFEFSGLNSKAIVWPIGTAIWTLFLLTSQKKAGTLLSMELNNRIKTSLGVGLATTLSLMLTDGEMQAITNVWGWAMTIALCAFLLSGFFRGLFSSIRNLSRLIPGTKS